ncbi:MAG: hypothetical protein ACREQI_11100 [Candidatus Binataceae bacterium]
MNKGLGGLEAESIIREWRRYSRIPRDSESFGDLLLQWDKPASHLERLAEIDAEFAAALRRYNITMEPVMETWESVRTMEAGRDPIQ